jgi:hypothetical protein
MTTAQSRSQHDDIERHKRETQYHLVGEQVLHTLGTPSNLLTVQVRLLWENHYRVNVFVGPDAASAQVANSYFLVVGSNGNIMTSTPEITKQY